MFDFSERLLNLGHWCSICLSSNNQHEDSSRMLQCSSSSCIHCQEGQEPNLHSQPMEGLQNLNVEINKRYLYDSLKKSFFVICKYYLKKHLTYFHEHNLLLWGSMTKAYTNILGHNHHILVWWRLVLVLGTFLGILISETFVNFNHYNLMNTIPIELVLVQIYLLPGLI